MFKLKLLHVFVSLWQNLPSWCFLTCTENYIQEKEEYEVCMQRMAPKLQNVTKVCDLIEVKIHMIENCTEQYSSAQDALLNNIFNELDNHPVLSGKVKDCPIYKKYRETNHKPILSESLENPMLLALKCR